MDVLSPLLVHRARGIVAALARVGIVLLVFALPAATPVHAADPATAAPATAAPWSHLDQSGEPIVDLWFGWSSACPHCAKARAWLAELEPRAPWLEVHALQVDGANADANVDELVGLAAGIDAEITGVPVFLFAARMEVGFDEPATTGADLEASLLAFRDSFDAAATPTPPDEGTAITLPFAGPVEARALSLPLLAVVLGGLDAVNPCALSVLLFLVSALVGANARRRILLVGGAFVAATGVVYFLLMAAWLNAFLWFGELRAVTIAAGVAAAVAGLINLKDFGWFRRGPSLVIPAAARPSIFGRILDLSDSVAMPAMLATTVVVAMTASVYEMLCTGGFPVVFTRVLTMADLPTPAYYAYLGLYVAVYVLPMVGIVALAAATLGTHAISIDQARRLKLLSGLLMLGVGGLLLLAPDRLSDLTWTLGLFGGAAALWLGLVVLDRWRRTASAGPPAPRTSST